MTSPKVSVIVPSYNHKPYVGFLIESIYEQSFKDFELIILDDGSKDGSPELLKELSKKYNFQLILKENEGLCKTLNKGITLAKGEYIIMIASDDIFTKDRIKEQVEYLDSNKHVDIVGGCMKMIDEKGNLCGEKVPAIIGNITFDQMVTINRVFAPSVMVRSSVFKRFGLYPEDYLLEDYYLWLKVLKNGGVIHNVKKTWVHYRIFNVNLEKKITWYYKGATQALNDYKSLEKVRKQLNNNLILYCIKLALLMGQEFKAKYDDHYLQLSLTGKLLTAAVLLIPGFLRDVFLKKLKLKV